MTLPLQRSRETVEVDVDLNADVPCGYKSCTPRTADWLAVTRCCGERVLLCDPHLRHVKRIFNPRAVCDDCDRQSDSFGEWVRLVRL